MCLGCLIIQPMGFPSSTMGKAHKPSTQPVALIDLAPVLMAVQTAPVLMDVKRSVLTVVALPALHFVVLDRSSLMQ